jgi:hypothetical protein
MYTQEFLKSAKIGMKLCHSDAIDSVVNTTQATTRSRELIDA